MKKIRCIILIYLVSLSLSLIACGNNLKATIEPTPTASASVAAEPTSTPTPTAIPTKTVEPTTDTKITAEPTDEVNEVTPTTVPTPTAEPKVEEVKAVSLEAKVNGSHKVGETLSAADFTITAKMSDGSTRSNPVGWQADKLTLDSESTVITVTYEGISTKVTVAATQPQAQKWPASAYESISAKAKNDIYDYSYTKGYVAKCDSSSGYDIWYVSKDDDDSCLSVVHETDGWAVVYWKSKSNDSYHSEKINAPSTLEHVYKHMFE